MPSAQDQCAERRFQLDHAAPGITAEILAATLGAAVHAIRLLLIWQGRVQRDPSETVVWVHMVVFATCLSTITALGRQRYLFVKGPLATWQTFLFIISLGIPLNSPGNGWFKHFLWTHRLLLVNLFHAVTRFSLKWYWVMAPISWSAVVLAESRNPTNDGSPPCLLLPQAVKQLLVHPVAVVCDIVTLPNAALYAAYVILPGVLLTYLELKARKRWQQRHQAAVSDKAGGPNAVVPRAVLQEHNRIQGSSSNQHHQANAGCKQAAGFRAGTTRPASSSAVAAAVARPKMAHPLLYNSPVHRRYVGIKLQEPPQAGAAEQHAVRKLVADALQAARSPDTAVATAASAQATAAPTVTYSTTCKGCCQLMYELLETQHEPTASEQQGLAGGTEQQQLESMQQQIRRVLPEGWGLQAVQQLVALPTTDTAPTFTMPGSTLAALSSLALADITLKPYIATVPPSAGDGGASMQVKAVLRLPHQLLQQLLQAGCQSVRVTVAERPTGDVILDQTQQLQPADAASAQRSMSAREATGMEDQLKLTVALPQVKQAQTTTQVKVLAVVVFAEITNGQQTSVPEHAAGAAAGITAAGSAVHAIRREVSAPAGEVGQSAASNTIVLAHLPLLLLPASAHEEMQQIVEAAVAEGMQQQEAQQQILLPLVEDWAALMLMSSGGCASTADTNVTSTAGALYESLSAYFADNNKWDCYELLVRADNGQVAVASGRSAEWPVSGIEQQVASSSTAAARNAGGDIRLRLTGLAANSSTLQGLVASLNINRQGLVDKGVGIPAESARGHGKEHPRQVAALILAWSKVLIVGFHDAAFEHAYNRWKAVKLQRHDLLVGVLHALGFAATLCQLVVLHTKHARYGQKAYILTVMRAILFAGQLYAHMLLLLASKKQQWVMQAGRWRGLFLTGNIAFLMAMATSGQVLPQEPKLFESAVHEAMKGCDLPAFLVMCYLHLVQPVLLQMDVGCTTVLVVFMTLFLEPLFLPGYVWFMGRTGTLVGFAVANIALAGWLDARLRNRFLNGHSPAG